MAAPLGSNASYWLYLSPIGAGFLRAVVGTPLDAVATREILHHQNTSQVVRTMKFLDFWKGFQPNLLKFTTRTPIQFGSVKLSSWIVPTGYDPAFRGIIIGTLSSGIETTVINGFNSLRTRFIQEDGWKVLKQEGAPVLKKGLSSALLHRILSGAIFWGIYEKLKNEYPSHGTAVSTLSGVVQVISTAPFYITAIYRQRKGAPREHLYRTFWHLYTTQTMRGLILPALAPRLVHSAVTSAPLMWLMEKLELVHRKI